MTWGEFKAAVKELLTVDRKRLGAEEFIERHLRLAVGDIQSYLPYYRRGMVTTYTVDDVTQDGDTSVIVLPEGMNLREVYYAKEDTVKIRRPLRAYEFSLRHDMISGVVEIGKIGQWFRYAIDQRDGARSMWVFPGLVSGWVIEITWDALLGRGGFEYSDSTWVPFDEPMVGLVAEWIKAKLAREVDRDLRLHADYWKSYQDGRRQLYIETEERLRQKVAASRQESDYDECEGEVEVEEPLGYVEFPTIAAMLAYPSRLYRWAKCWNGNEGDGIRSIWVRTENPALSDNGYNVRQTDDGAIVERIETNP